MEQNNQAYTVRKFLKENRNGVLSTISKDLEQIPYGSVCPYMMDQEGRPVFLISTIAEHTKNIIANDKACLTVMDEAVNPRLEGARVSYMGTAQKLDSTEEELTGKRYLRFFPEAESYFKAHGFHFYRINPKRIRYIEGFGKIYWVEAKDVLVPPSAALIQAENRIIEHMNKDHADSLVAYCKHYFNQNGGNPQMIAVDPEGFTVRTKKNDLYFTFSKECKDANQVRAEMVRMSNLSSRKSEKTNSPPTLD